MRIKSTLAVLLFSLTGSRLTIAGESRSVSIGDCTFAADPDQFLAREARFRRDLSAATQKLTAALPRAASSTT